MAQLGDNQHNEGVADDNTLATAADLGLRRDEISRQGAHVVGDNMSTADLVVNGNEVHPTARRFGRERQRHI